MSTCFWKTKRVIKTFDLFGTPVHLTYEGQRAFKTPCGGFCSILFLIAVIILLVTEVFSLVAKPTYSTSTTSYVYDEPMEVNPETFMLGAYLVATDDKRVEQMDIDLTEYYRITFKVGEEQIDAVHCSDLYAIYADNLSKLRQYDLWKDPKWVCPDLSQLQSQNIPKGGSIELNVVSCESSEGYTPYVDPSVKCKPAAESEKLSQDYDIFYHSQFMSTVFDSQQYHKSEQFGVFSRNFKDKLNLAYRLRSAQVVELTYVSFYDDIFMNSKNSAGFSQLSTCWITNFVDVYEIGDGWVKSDLQFEGFARKKQIKRNTFFGLLNTSYLSVKSTMALLSVLFAGHHQFISVIAMLKSLYSETDSPARPTAEHVDSTAAEVALEAHVSSLRSFEGNYYSYMIYILRTRFFCCLKNCCNQTETCKRHNKKWAKLELAKERLMKEHDIQHLISMSRVVQILQRATFRKRQRQAVNVRSKFVITDDDISEEAYAKRAASKVPTWPRINHWILAQEMTDGFDPANNAQDRRMLYDVAGLRLSQSEFDHVGSSDSDGVPPDGKTNWVLPLGQALVDIDDKNAANDPLITETSEQDLTTYIH